MPKKMPKNQRNRAQVEKKRAAIQSDYIELYNAGYSREHILNSLKKKYFLESRMIYRHLDIQTLKKAGKLNRSYQN